MAELENPSIPILDVPRNVISYASGGRRSGRGLTLRLIKYAALAAVLFYVIPAMWRDLRLVNWRTLEIRWSLVALAMAVQILAGFVHVAIRRQALAGFCTPLSWAAMAAISWVPQVGKYLPGRVAAMAGTVWMLRRRGIRESISVSLPLLLSGMSVLVGTIIAMPLVLRESEHLQISGARMVGVVVLVGLLICLHPRVFQVVMNAGLRLLRRQPLDVAPRLGSYVGPLALVAVSWGLGGVSLWALAASLTPLGPGMIPRFVEFGAMAAVFGFLVPVATAGLGVREGVFLAVLAPVVGASNAAIVTIAARLCNVIVDLVLAAAGWAIGEWVDPPMGVEAV